MSLTTKSVGHDSVSRPAAGERHALSARHVTAALRDLYRELHSHPGLRPGPEVDDLFARLVRLVLAVPDDVASAVLRDSSVQTLGPGLRELCARGEAELELAWAARIGAGASPHDELAGFPYLDNYRQLSRMEIGILASAVDEQVRSLAFVGAGPLPLSAVFLARELDVAVDNIDRDPVAVQAADRVAHALGFSELRFHQLDAADADLSSYDVVVVAALVGTTPADKRSILGHLARSMAPGAILLARSARGLRTMLYPAIEPDALDGFEVLTVVHPVNGLINSAVLARVRPHGRMRGE